MYCKNMSERTIINYGSFMPNIVIDMIFSETAGFSKLVITQGRICGNITTLRSGYATNNTSC